MGRVYNFSAGPSTLPEEVLKTAASELLDYNGTGTSVMEMSHRSSAFMDIITQAEALIRQLMDIPENYKVLFLQGGASTQFAAVPLNLMGKSKKADYINTGMWSKKAIAEAKRYGQINEVATSQDKNFTYIPSLTKDMFDPDAAYVHITTNNTIFGTKYTQLPDTGNVPIVADMSSNILSEKMDVTRFGIIYAGAQKNIGPAGVTVVIIRDDLLDQKLDFTPTMLTYKTHAESGSMYNTPPCYPIYMAKLVFQWLKEAGGVEAIQKINDEKAAILYGFLDDSKLFKATVEPQHRSLMNVPFVLPTDALNATFIKSATEAGLINLKGHRSVGGMRASIYNAMPVEGVKALVEFMRKFEQENS
ncbi:3-phosphoserine/phosphohydroxythreonine transaminase [Chitinispirillales bacterium ANBcel5]|uniref:3-phosphoserine/phosphohydroxythreonine transaminase n=1 Tax=Cellulosispirillum alkaliphilum TaxID=3039283 RepID=UPI002A58B27D|nr:3-phosphoserine/phosphohydroxythreonine transaminase [Chitinispirillales bacterium ANBcel5]